MDVGLLIRARGIPLQSAPGQRKGKCVSVVGAAAAAVRIESI